MTKLKLHANREQGERMEGQLVEHCIPPQLQSLHPSRHDSGILQAMWTKPALLPLFQMQLLKGQLRQCPAEKC